MSSSNSSYGSWPAVASAIKATAIRIKTAGGPSVNQLIAAAYFDRLLSRVFAQGDESEWLLKGGGSMLARVPGARTTKDIDLAATHTDDIEAALDALRAIIQTDIGDHLTFEIANSRPIVDAEAQPGTEGLRVTVRCLDVRSRRQVTSIPIDLVVEPAPTGTVQLVTPASRLPLPKDLPAHPYRLFPIADHLADKVCGIYTSHNGRPSSRVKDLVDIVIIANHEPVDLAELRVALATRAGIRGLELGQTLTTPDGWGPRYQALARTTAPGQPTVADGLARARELIDPALQPADAATAQTWHPAHGWQDTPTRETTHGTTDPSTAVNVRAHTRQGWPITAHQRSPRGRA